MSQDPTVFVVDDDVAAAASVRALMNAFGFACESFPSAEEFLERFDGSQTGCLVLDVRLSGMSGFDLRAELRRRQIDIPTILVSGHTDPDSSRQAMQQGAFAFLEKPYAGTALCDLIRSALAVDPNDADRTEDDSGEPDR